MRTARNPSPFRGSLPLWAFLSLCLPLGIPAASSGSPVLLSESGSGRATAYIESPKIITFDGRTHAAWLDTPEAGFRVKIRTLDHATGHWSGPWIIGEAATNHGGPALTIDEAGYLHVLYYSHHHPFRYRRSVRPNDASEWTPYTEFGTDLTYPALVCAPDGSLILTARRSYEDRPWELELWRKPPAGSWERQGAVLASRFPDYAQFAASLAWGPDHRVLHLATRLYEMPDNDRSGVVTTIGYLRSDDAGLSWTRLDGAPVELPATADSIEVLASGRASEGRALHAGSIGVDAEGRPHVPYSVRTQDSCQAWLAHPMESGSWRHRHLNPFLPAPYREWDLFMHGGVAFGSNGQSLVVATVMHASVHDPEWGNPTTEVVAFRSEDGGARFTSHLLGPPDPDSPRWMPNLERPTGFNEMPPVPSFLYTDGERGSGLEDQLSNRVYWVQGQ